MKDAHNIFSQPVHTVTDNEAIVSRPVMHALDLKTPPLSKTPPPLKKQSISW